MSGAFRPSIPYVRAVARFSFLKSQEMEHGRSPTIPREAINTNTICPASNPKNERQDPHCRRVIHTFRACLSRVIGGRFSDLIAERWFRHLLQHEMTTGPLPSLSLSPPPWLFLRRPLAAAFATLGPADKVGGGGGGGGATSGGGGSSAGGEEAGHPERQRRVQREMKNMMEAPHEVRR